jgi:hypothetical protein
MRQTISNTIKNATLTPKKEIYIRKSKGKNVCFNLEKNSYLEIQNNHF